ncbi:MAG: AMP-binding protein [Gammaproteobacteria bacterium]|nr:AMP-binding protein [Gammaproteobacteria bacterium]
MSPADSPFASDTASRWEGHADGLRRRIAIACGDTDRLWRDFERRAACVASLLHAYDIGPGTSIAFYLQDSVEYVEALFAAFKVGATPLTVASRFRSDDLVSRLIEARAEAVVFHGSYAARLWEIRDRLPAVRLWVQVDDGTEALLDFSLDFEQCITGHEPAPRAEAREQASGLLEWCHEAYATGAGGSAEDRLTLVVGPLSDPAQLALGVLAPLAHGDSVATIRQPMVEPHRLWTEAEDRAATDIVLGRQPGGAAAIEALDEAERLGSPYDLASVRRIYATTAWGTEVNAALARHAPIELIEVTPPT